MTGPIRVRRGTPADAAPLAELARATFRDAFGAENRPEDLGLHLARSYGPAQQSAELAHPSIITLLAFAGTELVGFAQVRTVRPPLCVDPDKALELWRFYVARAWHGRGAAQELMTAVVAAARAAGAATLWLGVWERNSRAQAFYKKSGFVDVGTQTFLVGTDEQNDRVLVMTIPQP